MRDEKDALWRNLFESNQEGEAMKARDAIKLASSLCERAEQPIKRETQQHVTSRIRGEQTPANCISLVCQNIPKQKRMVDFKKSCFKSSMANNQAN